VGPKDIGRSCSSINEPIAQNGSNVECQYLSDFHNLDRTMTVEHQNWLTLAAEFTDELATHSARTGMFVDVGRYRNGFDRAHSVAVRNCPADCYTLGAGPNWIGCVFDICTGYNSAL
jgi:hypothetical protein